MRINLKKYPKNEGLEAVHLTLTERLPPHVVAPCMLSCQYRLRAYDHYYLLELISEGEITLLCQRCLDSFSLPYHEESLLAICDSEATAEKLMSLYETMVETSHQIDLVDIVTDELHLSLPEMHAEVSLCNPQVAKRILG